MQRRSYFLVYYENGWVQQTDTMDAAYKHIHIMARHTRPLKIERVCVTKESTVIREWEKDAD
jgi:hypothetical protein